MFNEFGGFGSVLPQMYGHQQAQEVDLPDTSEQLQVSPLALLKMLKHSKYLTTATFGLGRSGIPFEVMGLMLGDLLDDFTLTVTDVFAMPQKATTVSVEAVDAVYQSEMLEMLKRVGFKQDQVVVGWYHSHPGFGCWLSLLDVKTQRGFEGMSRRAVALVVDPVQSAGGRVVMDAFRSIDPMNIAFNSEPRVTTSNEALLKKPTLDQRIRGLNKLFYSVIVNARANDDLEMKMLTNLK